MAEEKKMAKCEICGNSMEFHPDKEGSGIMDGALEANPPHQCCGKPMKIINIGG